MEVLWMTTIAVVYMINSRIGALLLLVASAHHLLVKRVSIYEKILRVIVFSAPYYIFSIWGDRQRFSLCTAATVVLCILLTISWLHRGARCNVVTACRTLLFILFFVAYAISVLFARTPAETIFDTYQILVLAYLLIIIPACKNTELKNIDTDTLLSLFAKGSCGLAIALYLQYGADVLLGVPLGSAYQYSTGRAIYNLYFYAKSVLSFYMSIGMLYYFVELINKKKHINSFIWLIVFFGATLINNSRTGLASFAIGAMLYCIMNPERIIGSLRGIVFLLLVAVAGVYIIQFMLESRGSLSGIADDNGRIELIGDALKKLPDYIISGIGGSAEDYRSIGMEKVPHNFVAQYLLQFGVLGGLALNILLISPLFDCNAHKLDSFYYLCCVITGGMLFANWHNSVFVIPIYIFALVGQGKQSGTLQKCIK